MSLGTDNQWLVKSSEVILGPYEFDQVVEHIFSGDIHLLDEIKGPFERWRPIKDHSLFAAAIEKLKASTYANRENTVTATVDMGTRTHEITQSQTDGNLDTPGQTPIVPKTEEVPYFQPNPASAQNQVPPMGQAQHQKSASSTVFILSFLLMLILGGGYYVYDYQQKRLIDQQASAYDRLTDQAIASLKVGEYLDSLSSFKKAYQISPNDSNLLIEMAPLSVQFDGQFSQTQLMVEELLSKFNNNDLMQVRGKTIVGLSYSYRGDFDQAINYYNLALQRDKEFLPPLYNKAFALMRKGDLVQASTLLRDVVNEFPDKAVAHYLYIRSLVENASKTNEVKGFEEALSVSSQFAQNFSDFKQEVLFLRAYAHFKLEASPDKLANRIKDFLKVDFELTNLHVHNVLIDFQSFQWGDFQEMCGQMASVVDEFTKQMALGFCQMKVNKTIQAKEVFESLLSQNNNDGLLQALYAASLLKLDQLSQAKNSLGFINQIDQKQPVVETILRGCLRAGDLSCGRALFQGRHAKHISLLYSHWGNSEVNLRKDRKRSKSSIRLGLDISPNFSPLLRLQNKR